jgi:translation initiation factor IF-2
MTPDQYMSPVGIRTGPPRPGTPSSAGAAPAPPRRPGGESVGDGGRREAPRGPSGRPLPTVAAPIATPPRAGGPQRPAAAPAAPKAQRPVTSMTRDEMLAVMKQGGVNALQSHVGGPSKPGPAGRGGPSQRGGGPAGPARPGAPAGPSLRRTGPGLGPAAPTAPAFRPEDEEEKKAKAGRLGSAADRAGRRARRNERAGDRRVGSPDAAAALLSEDEDVRRNRSGSRKPRGGQRLALAPTRKSRAAIEPPITVRGLSESIGIKASDLLRKLMAMNQMVTINATLDDDLAVLLAAEFGIELEVVHERTPEEEILEAFAATSAPEDLQPRPPVITILGHVDHGKTSLLDRIRQSNVVESESGGITQHIGAYQVESDGRPITFVDTPGHEAFTSMRARGANVTDIVVLVVAADDGVMPQTIEAIAHAKAAAVPIVVALNKIDLPNVETPANLNKISSELSQQGLHPVEWGGDTEVVRTSATTGQGIPELLETLKTIAELHELKADPSRPATGTCLEASLSEGRGVVATVLVQDGTLRLGDVIVCGDGFGRVRALFDDKGRSIDQAGPSTPVEVSGLDIVPGAGETFGVVDDISRAREVAEARRNRARDAAHADRQAVTLENLWGKIAEQKIKSLNLILKADVQGSIEALTKELEKLQNEEVPVRILLKAVGGITESDIVLADASQAIVIGFRVAPEDRALAQSEAKKIEIRRYDIIYQVTDDIKKAIEGMLIPEVKEVHLGRAVVRQVFKISKVGAVAGCFVTQGTIERSAKVRLIREGREIYKGAIEALKRFKDDIKEVPQNFECGIKIGNFDDVKIGDVIEAYRIDIIRRTL